MPPSFYRRLRLINWYPPFLAAGIRVTELAKDFSYCRVRMKLTWYNRNVVGTHFGGSLYAMVDPFYMLLLMGSLSADEYVIWDKAARIRFRRPGRGPVFAEFRVPPERLVEMRAAVAAAGGKQDFTFHVNVVDAAGTVIAEVEKVIYVRRKERSRPR
jgi:acyl-coenzyme A thioesterase PaaI-like protein